MKTQNTVTINGKRYTADQLRDTYNKRYNAGNRYIDDELVTRWLDDFIEKRAKEGRPGYETRLIQE